MEIKRDPAGSTWGSSDGTLSYKQQTKFLRKCDTILRKKGFYKNEPSLQVNKSSIYIADSGTAIFTHLPQFFLLKSRPGPLFKFS